MAVRVVTMGNRTVALGTNEATPARDLSAQGFFKLEKKKILHSGDHHAGCSEDDILHKQT
jgi:hypothetical protein